MSFEDKEFTIEQVVRSLRLCSDGGDCEDCDFFEADCPRGYNPCHEFKMMELAADYIEEKTAKVITEDNISICDNCSWVVYTGMRYCPSCGEKLEWDE